MKPVYNFERDKEMLDDRVSGMTYEEIGRKYGVSKQRVGQILGKRNKHNFRAVKEDGCIFVNLRDWMNKNSISRAELVRMMGMRPNGETLARLRTYMTGANNPPKVYIDRMIAATGMNYEKLFETG